MPTDWPKTEWPQTVVRTATSTGVFLKKNFWIWPLLAALVLGWIGYWGRSTVERTLRKQVADELGTIRNAVVSALEIWFRAQESNVTSVANDRRLQSTMAPLLELSKAPESALTQSKASAELRDLLKPDLEAHRYNGFLLLDVEGRILAANTDEIVGKKATALYEASAFFDKVMKGKPSVSPPVASALLLPDRKGHLRAGVPTMFAGAPVLGPDRKVQAVLLLRIQPDVQFSRIFSVARYGETGETYAFNKDGFLLSRSRFEEELKTIGLLVDRDDAESILSVALRDPGVDMTQGERPTTNRSLQPLTYPAAEAIQGKDGVNVDGYRDYRGVPTVGSWKWLPEYGMGVATEADHAEALRVASFIRKAHLILFGLLIACSLGLLVFMFLVGRLQATVRKAVLDAKQLGPYTLEEKIGSGGMGEVYRARHALLRRPTAVKLMNQTSDPGAAARFEREVQLTSQLNHPNTIAIYDYGQTPEGIFYYAMEYLDGLPLDALVQRFGPLPEGRVIHLLQQICASLSEAHGIGLIHRDIKPSNIILTRRGGIPDFIKVLDFGLVKATGAAKDAALTATNAITGTPQYLSPEAIEKPASADARSDLYAVGAVGYFLLTGVPIFRGEHIMEILMKQVNEAPEKPSARGIPIAADLEALIMRCLAKNPADRPASAVQLAETLTRCQPAGTWTTQDAATWWQAHATQTRAAHEQTSQPTPAGTMATFAS